MFKRFVGVVALSVVGMGVALAEVPAAVGTAITAIGTDATAMIALVWPVVLSVFGGLVLIKLFKRAGNKI